MLLNELNNFLEALQAPVHLAIGYSGGVDSHVLLHALKQLQATQSFSLRAIHLNHGLHPNSDNWEAHAKQVCAALDIPLTTQALNLNPQKGESIEAYARQARYDYFSTELKQNEILCTGHHQDDQLETVLLQLLRGAGPKGLAAMPQCEQQHARPLLSIPREDILHYAATHDLTWIDDESNANTQFDRNFLRHEIIPLLKQRFPAAAQTVSRSAGHCASSQQVLDHYLNQELMNLEGDFPDTLSRKKLLTFDANMQAYLLRTWLMNNNIPMPSLSQLTEIQKLLAMKNDVKAIVTWQNYSIRLYRDNLFAKLTAEFNPPKPVLSESIIKEIKKTLGDQNITIRFRQQGDGQTLKKFFQKHKIPPWERASVPLIYKGNDLVAILYKEFKYFMNAQHSSALAKH